MAGTQVDPPELNQFRKWRIKMPSQQLIPQANSESRYMYCISYSAMNKITPNGLKEFFSANLTNLKQLFLGSNKIT